MNNFGGSIILKIKSNLTSFINNLPQLLKKIQLKLENIILLGHSMGCLVALNYYDIFDKYKIDKLILIDEPPIRIKENDWTENESKKYGATFSPNDVIIFSKKALTEDSIQFSEQLIDSMTTTSISKENKNWLLEQNLKFNKKHLSALMCNMTFSDERDILSRIDVPTLLIGGKVSIFPWQAQVWMNKQIPNSELVIFEEDEGGSHFMFLENAKKFNQIVKLFLSEK